MIGAWDWAIVGGLTGVGVTVILWQSITWLARKLVGGETMQNFARRVTSREFLAFGFVGTYAIIITVGGYAVPDYVQNVIMPAVMLFGGFMAITGRNKNNGS